jgi:hypothetical protein
MMLPQDCSRHALWPRDRRQALVAAALLWAVPMLVITVDVILHPLHRSVTPDTYHYAAGQWWVHESLYVGPLGFNYLPHFAILFGPFHFLPVRLGEVLWRWCAVVMLIGGLWQTVTKLLRSEPERSFFWASLISMPLAMSSLRNGQANAHFGGVLLLSVAAILAERWWLALGLMALATAIKPLGIVLLMLAPLVYAPMRWRLPFVVLALAIFPFLFAGPGYVWSQYREAWTNLQACAVVTEHRFADINGIFRTFGAALPPQASKLVRVAAGALTAGGWWWGAKRLREPPTALWFYALAASYLMLFNPMNEANSYVILSPAFGVWGAWFLLGPGPQSQRRLGWALVFIALTMGLLPNVLRPLLGNYFALFWHPCMTVVFIVMLTNFVWRSAASPAGELHLKQV